MLATVHHKVKEYTGGNRSAIIVWTVGIKLFCVPLYILSARSKRQLYAVQSLFKAINSSIPPHMIRMSRFRQEPLRKSEITQEVTNARQFIFAKHKISFLKTRLFAPLAQLPIWIYASLSLRKMSGMGGFLPNWIDNNLHVPVQIWDLDTTGLWPLAIYIGMLHSINCYLFPAPSTQMKYFLAGLSGISIPIASLLPESVVVFWCTSSTYTLLQNLVFESEFMDKYLGPKNKKISPKLVMTQNELLK
eukprot:NODE_10_length_47437_cov_0.363429.p15 type:complete len:247 gc:universal NODE_10_length_47437_cov_0.363429:7696-6956(-)